MTNWLRQRADHSLELDVHLQPRASREYIGEVHGDRLKIHVRAAPVDGHANEALCRLLADALDCPVRDVTIIRGHTNRRKTVHVVGVSLAAALACGDRRVGPARR